MKIVHVVGARPNFMKVAPTMAALDARSGVEQRLVHTGQHYDHVLSDVFFEDLHLPAPDHYLGVGSGSHGVQVAGITLGLEPILKAESPDAVLVAGDTNSAMAAAVSAAKLNIPVIHLEAGLRSGDRSMPEEVNRIVADHLSRLLLTPSRDADDNLIREGVAADLIAFVGNTMIDSLRENEARARELDIARSEYGVEDYILVTLHRPSLVDDEERLVEVMEMLEQVAQTRVVLFPIHPRTADVLHRAHWKPRRVKLLEPQSYLRFLSLEATATAVLTDSGGIQEETTILGVPCYTLRTTTERPLTVSQGTNRVLGLGSEALAAFRSALDDPMRRHQSPPEGWDGHAAARVADAILGEFGGRKTTISAAAVG